MKKIAYSMKWQSLIAKNGKICLKEIKKSLVGLAPGRDQTLFKNELGYFKFLL